MTNTCKNGEQPQDGRPNAPIYCKKMEEIVDGEPIKKPCPLARDGHTQNMCNIYEGL